MKRAYFDRLRTVRLERESQNGHTEICQEPAGTYWIKICVKSPACQRELLNALDESIPVRLEHGALELLLPWHEGVSLRQWLYERTPTLGQRRDACLSLLEQQVDMHKKLPPCLTALAADPENLTVENTAMFLQHLPELRHWVPGMGEAEAVRAVASVVREVLTPELSRWSLRQLPEELRLFYRRQEEQDYANWGQLQRDVAAIPDDLPRIRPPWNSYMRRFQSRLLRYGTWLLRILAVLLLAAALVSLVSAYCQWRSEDKTVWPDMSQVGDQDLRNGEGGGK